MADPTPRRRPVDPRAGKLCTSCNKPKPADARKHCPSPTCDWWKCTCGAVNDRTGSNDRTNRDGTPRDRS